MTHSDIDTLVKSWIIDAATRPANPRVQHIVVRLVSDLCKAMEDLDIQASEFWKGLEYLSAAGNELGLLAPGLGLERFIDIRADEAEARAGLTGGTPRTIEGPLYVAGAPESHGFARLDDGTELEKAEAEILFMQGTVYDSNGKPMPNTRVEVWHANLMGNYSFFDQTQSAFNLRRSIITDEHGRYQFRSIMPMGYGCPPEGTTQKLLDLLGRHGRRPAHIHFFVTATGHRKLTTQINIDGDEYLWDDFAFASREGLVPVVTRITDAHQLAAKGVNTPYASIDFDFHLYADTTTAPDAEVERIRAVA